MKVDAGTYAPTIDAAGELAVAAEGDGYDGWWAFETQIDPFLACTVAAERTERVEHRHRDRRRLRPQPDDRRAAGQRRPGALRRPLHRSASARRSSRTSPGATRCPGRSPRRGCASSSSRSARSGSPGRPAATLDFEGDFYTHTLMAPFFNPGPNPHGNPKIMLAAVGPLMTEAAGEVADGVLCHAFSTERYMREATLPALEKRLREGRAARSRGSRSPPRRSSSPATPRRRSPRASRSSSSRSPSTARPRPTGRCSTCTAGASSRTS